MMDLLVVDHYDNYYAQTFGSYYFNSDALTNKFVNDLYFYKFIGNEQKDQVTSRLKANNHSVFDLQYGFEASQYADDLIRIPGIRYTIALKNRVHVSATWPKDLFELAFKGNAQFAGETAVLGKVNFSYYRYQQLFAGFDKEFESGERKIRLGIGVSINKGIQYSSVVIEKADFFTQIDGEYLELDLEMEYQTSDPKNTTYSDLTGLGLGASAVIEIKGVKGNKISAGLTDLGFIGWDNYSKIYTADDLYTFDGIEILNILDVDSTVFSHGTIDSIVDSYLPGKSRNPVNTFTPSFIYFNYLHHFDQFNLKVITGVQYGLQVNYAPYLYARAIYQVSDNLALMPVAAYGGYGSLSIGLGFSVRLGDHYLLTLHSDMLDGYILPSSTTGQGIFLSLGKVK